MNAPRISMWRASACAVLLALGALTLRGGSAATVGARQEATPATSYSCDSMLPDATPAADEHGRAGMETGTPASGMAVEFDQLYIDMMIPHHQSIIALAQVALPRLTDARLQAIAQNIVAGQSAEIPELERYRQQFYGSAEPHPMDQAMMDQMMQIMPGMGSMEDMAKQMDAAALVAEFCAAADPNLTFIDLTIPHHEMAIAASEMALAQATHQEIKDFAQTVIDAQQREIDELTAIRGELAGEATPAGTPAAVGRSGPVVDQAGLVAALRAAGLTVESAGSLMPDVPFGGALGGTVLRLGGGGMAGPVELQVYEYADATAAEADAAQIGPDGNPRTATIEWIGPPHLFRAGRLIVLYVGSDRAVTAALTALLGPQFAGA